ncbi:conserved Plasmodium protein, unknown function [Plasmodium chabaudi chabaudi]|uniref:PI3K/PI4K catalytic domain-containing protein n=1 Tax=Plasmodium chabaudi chabaudi TaxID=31271 RepID=A0A1D3S233_PLACU|nr:conserved Plasmodium protein, unknown function [Plasmodium chabaudi chabaudi]
MMEKEIEDKLKGRNFLYRNIKLGEDKSETKRIDQIKMALLNMSDEEEEYFLTDIYPLLKKYILNSTPLPYYSNTHVFRKNVLTIFYSLIYKLKKIKYIIEIFDMCLNSFINESEECGIICIKIMTEICILHKNDLISFDIYKYINVVSKNILKKFYKNIINKVKRGKLLKSEINIYKKIKCHPLNNKNYIQSSTDSLKFVREIVLSNYIIINLYPKLLNNNENYIKTLCKILSVINIFDFKCYSNFFIEDIKYSKNTILKTAYYYHFSNSDPSLYGKSGIEKDNCDENLKYCQNNNIEELYKIYSVKSNIFNANVNNKNNINYKDTSSNCINSNGNNNVGIPHNEESNNKDIVMNNLKTIKKEFYKNVKYSNYYIDMCKVNDLVNLKNSVIHILCNLLKLDCDNMYFEYKEFLIQKIIQSLKYDTHYTIESKKVFIENISLLLHKNFDETLKYYIDFLIDPKTYMAYLANNDRHLSVFVFMKIHDIFLYFKNKNVWNFSIIKSCISNYSAFIMNSNNIIFIQTICLKLLHYIIEIVLKIKRRNYRYFSLYYDILNILLQKSNSLKYELYNLYKKFFNIAYNDVLFFKNKRKTKRGKAEKKTSNGQTLHYENAIGYFSDNINMPLHRVFIRKGDSKNALNKSMNITNFMNNYRNKQNGKKRKIGHILYDEDHCKIETYEEGVMEIIIDYKYLLYSIYSCIRCNIYYIYLYFNKDIIKENQIIVNNGCDKFSSLGNNNTLRTNQILESQNNKLEESLTKNNAHVKIGIDCNHFNNDNKDSHNANLKNNLISDNKSDESNHVHNNINYLYHCTNLNPFINSDNFVLNNHKDIGKDDEAAHILGLANKECYNSKNNYLSIQEIENCLYSYIYDYNSKNNNKLDNLIYNGKNNKMDNPECLYDSQIINTVNGVMVDGICLRKNNQKSDSDTEHKENNSDNFNRNNLNTNGKKNVHQKRLNNNSIFEDMHDINDINFLYEDYMDMSSYELNEIWLKILYKLFYRMLICSILFNSCFSYAVIDQLNLRNEIAKKYLRIKILKNNTYDSGDYDENWNLKNIGIDINNLLKEDKQKIVNSINYIKGEERKLIYMSANIIIYLNNNNFHDFMNYSIDILFKLTFQYPQLFCIFQILGALRNTSMLTCKVSLNYTISKLKTILKHKNNLKPLLYFSKNARNKQFCNLSRHRLFYKLYSRFDCLTNRCHLINSDLICAYCGKKSEGVNKKNNVFINTKIINRYPTCSNNINKLNVKKKRQVEIYNSGVDMPIDCFDLQFLDDSKNGIEVMENEAKIMDNYLWNNLNSFKELTYHDENMFFYKESNSINKLKLINSCSIKKKNRKKGCFFHNINKCDVIYSEKFILKDINKHFQLHKEKREFNTKKKLIEFGDNRTHGFLSDGNEDIIYSRKRNEYLESNIKKNCCLLNDYNYKSEHNDEDNIDNKFMFRTKRKNKVRDYIKSNNCIMGYNSISMNDTFNKYLTNSELIIKILYLILNVIKDCPNYYFYFLHELKEIIEICYDIISKDNKCIEIVNLLKYILETVCYINYINSMKNKNGSTSSIDSLKTILSNNYNINDVYGIKYAKYDYTCEKDSQNCKNLGSSLFINNIIKSVKEEKCNDNSIKNYSLNTKENHKINIYSGNRESISYHINDINNDKNFNMNYNMHICKMENTDNIHYDVKNNEHSNYKIKKIDIIYSFIQWFEKSYVYLPKLYRMLLCEACLNFPVCRFLDGYFDFYLKCLLVCLNSKSMIMIKTALKSIEDILFNADNVKIKNNLYSSVCYKNKNGTKFYIFTCLMKLLRKKVNFDLGFNNIYDQKYYFNDIFRNLSNSNMYLEMNFLGRKNKPSEREINKYLHKLYMENIYKIIKICLNFIDNNELIKNLYSDMNRKVYRKVHFRVGFFLKWKIKTENSKRRPIKNRMSTYNENRLEGHAQNSVNNNSYDASNLNIKRKVNTFLEGNTENMPIELDKMDETKKISKMNEETNIYERKNKRKKTSHINGEIEDLLNKGGKNSIGVFGINDGNTNINVKCIDKYEKENKYKLSDNNVINNISYANISDNTCENNSNMNLFPIDNIFLNNNYDSIMEHIDLEKAIDYCYKVLKRTMKNNGLKYLYYYKNCQYHIPKQKIVFKKKSIINKRKNKEKFTIFNFDEFRNRFKRKFNYENMDTIENNCKKKKTSDGMGNLLISEEENSHENGVCSNIERSKQHDNDPNCNMDKIGIKRYETIKNNKVIGDKLKSEKSGLNFPKNTRSNFIRNNDMNYFEKSDVCYNCIQRDQRINCYRIIITVFIFLFNHSICISDFYEYMLKVGAINNDFMNPSKKKKRDTNLDANNNEENVPLSNGHNSKKGVNKNNQNNCRKNKSNKKKKAINSNNTEVCKEEKNRIKNKEENADKNIEDNKLKKNTYISSTKKRRKYSFEYCVCKKYLYKCAFIYKDPNNNFIRKIMYCFLIMLVEINMNRNKTQSDKLKNGGSQNAHRNEDISFMKVCIRNEKGKKKKIYKRNCYDEVRNDKLRELVKHIIRRMSLILSSRFILTKKNNMVHIMAHNNELDISSFIFTFCNLIDYCPRFVETTVQGLYFIEKVLKGILKVQPVKMKKFMKSNFFSNLCTCICNICYDSKVKKKIFGLLLLLKAIRILHPYWIKYNIYSIIHTLLICYEKYDLKYLKIINMLIEECLTMTFASLYIGYVGEMNAYILNNFSSSESIYVEDINNLYAYLNMKEENNSKKLLYFKDYTIEKIKKDAEMVKSFFSINEKEVYNKNSVVNCGGIKDKRVLKKNECFWYNYDEIYTWEILTSKKINKRNKNDVSKMMKILFNVLKMFMGNLNKDEYDRDFIKKAFIIVSKVLKTSIRNLLTYKCSIKNNKDSCLYDIFMKDFSIPNFLTSSLKRKICYLDMYCFFLSQKPYIKFDFILVEKLIENIIKIIEYLKKIDGKNKYFTYIINGNIMNISSNDDIDVDMLEKDALNIMHMDQTNSGNLKNNSIIFDHGHINSSNIKDETVKQLHGSSTNLNKKEEENADMKKSIELQNLYKKIKKNHDLYMNSSNIINSSLGSSVEYDNEMNLKNMTIEVNGNLTNNKNIKYNNNLNFYFKKDEEFSLDDKESCMKLSNDINMGKMEENMMSNFLSDKCQTTDFLKDQFLKEECNHVITFFSYFMTLVRICFTHPSYKYLLPIMNPSLNKKKEILYNRCIHILLDFLFSDQTDLCNKAEETLRHLILENECDKDTGKSGHTKTGRSETMKRDTIENNIFNNFQKSDSLKLALRNYENKKCSINNLLINKNGNKASEKHNKLTNMNKNSINKLKLNKDDFKLYLKSVLGNLSYALKHKSFILKKNFIIGLSKIYYLFPHLFSPFLMEGFVQYLILFKDVSANNKASYNNIDHIICIYSEFFKSQNLSYEKYKEIMDIFLKIHNNFKKGSINFINNIFELDEHMLGHTKNKRLSCKNTIPQNINNLNSRENSRGDEINNTLLDTISNNIKGKETNNTNSSKKKKANSNKKDVDNEGKRQTKNKGDNDSSKYNENVSIKHNYTDQNLSKNNDDIELKRSSITNQLNTIDGFVTNNIKSSIEINHSYMQILCYLCCNNYENTFKYFIANRHNNIIFSAFISLLNLKILSEFRKYMFLKFNVFGNLLLKYFSNFNSNDILIHIFNIFVLNINIPKLNKLVTYDYVEMKLFVDKVFHVNLEKNNGNEKRKNNCTFLECDENNAANSNNNEECKKKNKKSLNEKIGNNKGGDTSNDIQEEILIGYDLNSSKILSNLFIIINIVHVISKYEPSCIFLNFYNERICNNAISIVENIYLCISYIISEYISLKNNNFVLFLNNSGCRKCIKIFIIFLKYSKYFHKYIETDFCNRKINNEEMENWFKELEQRSKLGNDINSNNCNNNIMDIIEHNDYLFYLRTNIFNVLIFIISMSKNIDYSYTTEFIKKYVKRNLKYREMRYLFFSIIHILNRFKMPILNKFYEISLRYIIIPLLKNYIKKQKNKKYITYTENSLDLEDDTFLIDDKIFINLLSKSFLRSDINYTQDMNRKSSLSNNKNATSTSKSMNKNNDEYNQNNFNFSSQCSVCMRVTEDGHENTNQNCRRSEVINNTYGYLPPNDDMNNVGSTISMSNMKNSNILKNKRNGKYIHHLDDYESNSKGPKTYCLFYTSIHKGKYNMIQYPFYKNDLFLSTREIFYILISLLNCSNSIEVIANKLIVCNAIIDIVKKLSSKVEKNKLFICLKNFNMIFLQHHNEYIKQLSIYNIINIYKYGFRNRVNDLKCIFELLFKYKYEEDNYFLRRNFEQLISLFCMTRLENSKVSMKNIIWHYYSKRRFYIKAFKEDITSIMDDESNDISGCYHNLRNTNYFFNYKNYITEYFKKGKNPFEKMHVLVTVLKNNYVFFNDCPYIIASMLKHLKKFTKHANYKKNGDLLILCLKSISTFIKFNIFCNCVHDMFNLKNGQVVIKKFEVTSNLEKMDTKRYESSLKECTYEYVSNGNDYENKEAVRINLSNSGNRNCSVCYKGENLKKTKVYDEIKNVMYNYYCQNKNDNKRKIFLIGIVNIIKKYKYVYVNLNILNLIANLIVSTLLQWQYDISLNNIAKEILIIFEDILRTKNNTKLKYLNMYKKLLYFFFIKCANKELQTQSTSQCFNMNNLTNGNQNDNSSILNDLVFNINLFESKYGKNEMRKMELESILMKEVENDNLIKDNFDKLGYKDKLLHSSLNDENKNSNKNEVRDDNSRIDKLNQFYEKINKEYNKNYIVEMTYMILKVVFKYANKNNICKKLNILCSILFLLINCNDMKIERNAILLINHLILKHKLFLSDLRNILNKNYIKEKWVSKSFFTYLLFDNNFVKEDNYEEKIKLLYEMLISLCIKGMHEYKSKDNTFYMNKCLHIKIKLETSILIFWFFIQLYNSFPSENNYKELIKFLLMEYLGNLKNISSYCFRKNKLQILKELIFLMNSRLYLLDKKDVLHFFKTILKLLHMERKHDSNFDLFILNVIQQNVLNKSMHWNRHIIGKYHDSTFDNSSNGYLDCSYFSKLYEEKCDVYKICNKKSEIKNMIEKYFGNKKGNKINVNKYIKYINNLRNKNANFVGYYYNLGRCNGLSLSKNRIIYDKVFKLNFQKNAIHKKLNNMNISDDTYNMLLKQNRNSSTCHNDDANNSLNNSYCFGSKLQIFIDKEMQKIIKNDIKKRNVFAKLYVGNVVEDALFSDILLCRKKKKLKEIFCMSNKNECNSSIGKNANLSIEEMAYIISKLILFDYSDDYYSYVKYYDILLYFIRCVKSQYSEKYDLTDLKNKIYAKLLPNILRGTFSFLPNVQHTCIQIFQKTFLSSDFFETICILFKNDYFKYIIDKYFISLFVHIFFLFFKHNIDMYLCLKNKTQGLIPHLCKHRYWEKGKAVHDTNLILYNRKLNKWKGNNINKNDRSKIEDCKKLRKKNMKIYNSKYHDWKYYLKKYCNEQEKFIDKCKSKLIKSKYLFQPILCLVNIFKEYCKGIWIDIFSQLFNYLNYEQINCLNFCVVRFLYNYINIYELNESNDNVKRFIYSDEKSLARNSIYQKNGYKNEYNINVLETMLVCIFKANIWPYVPPELIFYCSSKFCAFEVSKYILQALLFYNLKKIKEARDRNEINDAATIIDQVDTYVSNNKNNHALCNNGMNELLGKQENATNILKAKKDNSFEKVYSNNIWSAQFVQNNYKQTLNYLIEINRQLNDRDSVYALYQLYINNNEFSKSLFYNHYSLYHKNESNYMMNFMKYENLELTNEELNINKKNWIEKLNYFNNVSTISEYMKLMNFKKEKISKNMNKYIKFGNSIYCLEMENGNDAMLLNTNYESLRSEYLKRLNNVYSIINDNLISINEDINYEKKVNDINFPNEENNILNEKMRNKQIIDEIEFKKKIEYRHNFENAQGNNLKEKIGDSNMIKNDNGNKRRHRKNGLGMGILNKKEDTKIQTTIHDYFRTTKDIEEVVIDKNNLIENQLNNFNGSMGIPKNWNYSVKDDKNNICNHGEGEKIYKDINNNGSVSNLKLYNELNCKDKNNNIEDIGNTYLNKIAYMLKKKRDIIIENTYTNNKNYWDDGYLKSRNVQCENKLMDTKKVLINNNDDENSSKAFIINKFKFDLKKKDIKMMKDNINSGIELLLNNVRQLFNYKSADLNTLLLHAQLFEQTEMSIEIIGEKSLRAKQSKIKENESNRLKFLDQLYNLCNTWNKDKCVYYYDDIQKLKYSYKWEFLFLKLCKTFIEEQNSSLDIPSNIYKEQSYGENVNNPHHILNSIAEMRKMNNMTYDYFYKLYENLASASTSTGTVSTSNNNSAACTSSSTSNNDNIFHGTSNHLYNIEIIKLNLKKLLKSSSSNKHYTPNNNILENCISICEDFQINNTQKMGGNQNDKKEMICHGKHLLYIKNMENECFNICINLKKIGRNNFALKVVKKIKCYISSLNLINAFDFNSLPMIGYENYKSQLFFMKGQILCNLNKLIIFLHKNNFIENNRKVFFNNGKDTSQNILKDGEPEGIALPDIIEEHIGQTNVNNNLNLEINQNAPVLINDINEKASIGKPRKRKTMKNDAKNSCIKKDENGEKENAEINKIEECNKNMNFDDKKKNKNGTRNKETNNSNNNIIMNNNMIFDESKYNNNGYSKCNNKKINIFDTDLIEDCFLTSLKINSISNESWVVWADYCNKMFKEYKNISFGISSIISYLIYSSLNTNKGFYYLSNVFYLLNYDDDENSMMKIFNKYNNNISSHVWLFYLPFLLNNVNIDSSNYLYFHKIFYLLIREFPQDVFYSLRASYIDRKKSLDCIKSGHADKGVSTNLANPIEKINEKATVNNLQRNDISDTNLVSKNNKVKAENMDTSSNKGNLDMENKLMGSRMHSANIMQINKNDLIREEHVNFAKNNEKNNVIGMTLVKNENFHHDENKSCNEYDNINVNNCDGVVNPVDVQKVKIRKSNVKTSKTKSISLKIEKMENNVDKKNEKNVSNLLNNSYNANEKETTYSGVIEDGLEQIMCVFKNAHSDVYLSLDYMCNEIINYTKFQAHEKLYYLVSKMLNQCINFSFSKIHISKLIQNFTENNIIYKIYKSKIKSNRMYSKKYSNVIRIMKQFWKEYKKDMKYLKEKGRLKNLIEAKNDKAINSNILDECDDIKKMGNYFLLSEFTKIVKKWKDILFVIIYSLKESPQFPYFSYSFCDMFSKFPIKVEVPGLRLKYIGEHLNYNYNFNTYTPSYIIKLTSPTFFTIRNNSCLNKIKFITNDGNVHHYTVYPCNFTQSKSEYKYTLFQILLNNILYKFPETQKRGLSLRVNINTMLHPFYKLVQDNMEYITLKELYNEYMLANKNEKYLIDNVVLYHRKLIKDSISKFVKDKIRFIKSTKENETKLETNIKSSESNNMNNMILEDDLKKDANIEDTTSKEQIADCNTNDIVEEIGIERIENVCKDNGLDTSINLSIDYSSMVFEKLIHTLNENEWCRKLIKNAEKKSLKRHYKDISKIVPKNIMKDYFYSLHNNLENYYILNDNFVKNYSLLCMLNYIFLQSDISLDNILISKYSGSTMYLYGFPSYMESGKSKAKKRKKVYDIIPFRLTENIQEFIGFQGLKGSFPLNFYASVMAIKKNWNYIESFLKQTIYDDFCSLHMNKKSRMAKRSDKIISTCGNTFKIDKIEKNKILINSENCVNDMFYRMLFLYNNKLEKMNNKSCSKKDVTHKKKVMENVYEHYSDVYDVSLSELSSDENMENAKLRKAKSRKNFEKDIQNKKENGKVSINKEDNTDEKYICDNNSIEPEVKCKKRKIHAAKNNENKDDEYSAQKEIDKPNNGRKQKRKNKNDATIDNVQENQKENIIEELANENEENNNKAKKNMGKNPQKRNTNTRIKGNNVKVGDKGKYSKLITKINAKGINEENIISEDKEKIKNISQYNKSIVDLIELSMDRKHLRQTKGAWFPWF